MTIQKRAKSVLIANLYMILFAFPDSPFEAENRCKTLSLKKSYTHLIMVSEVISNWVSEGTGPSQKYGTVREEKDESPFLTMLSVFLPLWDKKASWSYEENILGLWRKTNSESFVSLVVQFLESFSQLEKSMAESILTESVVFLLKNCRGGLSVSEFSRYPPSPNFPLLLRS